MRISVFGSCLLLVSGTRRCWERVVHSPVQLRDEPAWGHVCRAFAGCGEALLEGIGLRDVSLGSDGFGMLL